jgi:hypothetical protein
MYFSESKPNTTCLLVVDGFHCMLPRSLSADTATTHLVFHIGGYGNRYRVRGVSYRRVCTSIPGGIEIDTAGYEHPYRGYRNRYQGVWKSIPGGMEIDAGGIEMGLLPYR